jgi:RNA polymerase sigma factor (sigma-70 family)
MPAELQVDAGLLDQLRRRDPEVLASTVQEHARPLFRAARGMGFSDEQAEDVVQDVFTTFLETLDRFEGKSQLRTWLFGILHNKIRERRREVWRDEQYDPIDAVFESRFDTRGNWVRPPENILASLESAEVGIAVNTCMETLPGAQREAFLLREIQECETPEICKILEITVTNLHVLLHRARIRLRECMESKGWGKRR